MLVYSLSVGFQSSSRKLSSSSLQATGTAIVSPEKFQALQKAFPKDYDVVKAGGWYKLQTLAALDPKEELVNMIVDGLQKEGNKVEFQSDEETLEALMILLYGKGKGFEADVVDGDWALVFSRQGTKSPRFQKLVGKKEKAGFTLNIFDIRSMTFAGDVKFFKNTALVHSTVKVRICFLGEISRSNDRFLFLTLSDVAPPCCPGRLVRPAFDSLFQNRGWQACIETHRL